jgi:hypothetical protein
MEKRLFCLAFFVVLWTTTSLGQIINLPLASVPNPQCGSYPSLSLSADIQCGSVSHSPWSASGGGWNTDVSFTNTGTKPVTYEVCVLPAPGKATTVSAKVQLSLSGSTPIPGQTGIITLGPNVSADVNITSSDGLQTGSVEVIVMAPDAATLDAQQATQLTYIYTPADGSPTLQVAVPFVRDPAATVTWGSRFTETPPAAKNSLASNNSSFAVLNLFNQAQSVLITISDSNNNPIVSAQTDPLAPGATTAFVLADWFGSTMFPGIVSQDGLFHGNISFKGMGGGTILPLMLRAIGNSISSLPVWQTSQ